MRKRWQPLDRSGFAKHIGDRIRRLRIARVWTQPYLASLLEIPRSRIDQYERGELLPPTYTLYQLAGLFGVSPGALVDGPAPREADSSGALSVFSRLLSLSLDYREALLTSFETAVSAVERLQVARSAAHQVQGESPMT